MMYKIEKKEQVNYIIKFLISISIFISASPLFETFLKLVATSSVALIIYIITHERLNFKKNDFFIIFFLFFLVSVYGLFLDLKFGSELSYQGLGFFLFLFLGFFLAQRVSREIFFRANEDIVGLSLLIGLPIYFLTLLFPWIIQYGIIYDYGGFKSITFIFTNILILDGESIQRFVGFGSEPGLTQIFYLLAIFSRLSRNVGRLDLFLLIVFIAIVLSKSTFGLFLSILLLAYLMPLKSLIKYTIIFIPIIIFVLIDEFYYHISSKLIGSNSFSGRYDRYADFFSGDFFNVFFGYGNSYYVNFIAPLGIGGWDSFLQISQRYGLIFTFALFVLLFFNNRKEQFPVFLIIALAFFTQSIWFLPVIAYFYFDGMGAPPNKFFWWRLHR